MCGISRDQDTTTFAVAQQIRRVSLWGMSREFNMKSFNWSLLKYLTLTTHGMAFTPCMSLLVECQNLLSVSVTIIYLTEQDKEPWRSSHPPRPRYIHEAEGREDSWANQLAYGTLGERLHTLEIFADHTDVEFGFFVHWLLLPALRRLVLKGPVGVSLRPHVMEMITRDHCKLEELVPVRERGGRPPRTPASNTGITEIFGGTYKAFGEDIIRRLTFNPRAPTEEYLLPKLVSMWISCVTADVDPWLIEDMVFSRRRDGEHGHPVQLSHVNVTQGCVVRHHEWFTGDEGYVRRTAYPVRDDHHYVGAKDGNDAKSASWVHQRSCRRHFPRDAWTHCGLSEAERLDTASKLCIEHIKGLKEDPARKTHSSSAVLTKEPALSGSSSGPENTHVFSPACAPQISGVLKAEWVKSGAGFLCEFRWGRRDNTAVGCSMVDNARKSLEKVGSAARERDVDWLMTTSMSGGVETKRRGGPELKITFSSKKAVISRRNNSESKQLSSRQYKERRGRGAEDNNSVLSTEPEGCGQTWRGTQTRLETDPNNCRRYGTLLGKKTTFYAFGGMQRVLRTRLYSVTHASGTAPESAESLGKLIWRGNTAPDMKLLQRHSEPGPIDTIPVELLSEIMILSLPLRDFTDDTWYRDGQWEYPMCLATVSRRWKVVAHNTPQLWCCIVVHPQGASRMKADECLMKTWIARSRAAPLSIYFNIAKAQFSESGQPSLDEDSYTRCFELIKENLHRCMQLELYAPSHMLSALPRVSLPYLETVQLGTCSEEDLLAFQHGTPFSSAPRLQHVYLTGISAAFNVKSFNWAALTYLSLNLTGVAFTPCMALLAECSNLLTLKLYMNNFAEQNAEPWRDGTRPRPSYEKLHTLEVHGLYSYLDFAIVIQWHFFPALRRLRLDGLVFLRLHVLDIITRDGCKLEELSIHSSGVPPFLEEEGDLLELFRVLPDLRVFQFAGTTQCVFGNDTIRRMTFRPGGASASEEYLLPKLESLQIQSINRDCDPQLLEDMLVLRAKQDGEDAPPVRLEHVDIRQCKLTQHNEWYTDREGDLFYRACPLKFPHHCEL
ncbi:hypothetical protein GLOTRDRAFT_96677 [Gloeophyllum trabeum ATCC 11539]|uniref:F-box domain-containing protein n=1 Tax=Gloeophyllum trabeum (strain ATCC 11539 / FP-39264 / Madison 617) TaxID=670483 RepID=S7PTN4_GLOTA|nr:uncharacterized protein GLOTRDRAFT_96677 [Gloeophyllum trabeum ATCC 11539]EPQ51141.1 hypothetical protein GLOTRDRAFT_96677 [Gloeophyllum trabeum ATCC 11539]